jgi:hypothetical protein
VLPVAEMLQILPSKLYSKDLYLKKEYGIYDNRFQAGHIFVQNHRILELDRILD